MQSSLPFPLPNPPPAPDADAVDKLVKTADSIGQLLQNAHQGFLPNKRQQRAAGLGIIELAQAVRHDVELMIASGAHLEVSFCARFPAINFVAILLHFSILP